MLDLDPNGVDGTYHKRLATLSNTFLQLESTQGLSWDLIGINEAHAFKANTKLGGKNKQFQKVQLIQCLANGTFRVYMMPCFNAHLRDPDGFQDYAYQWGEIGIIAKKDVFLALGSWKKELIGKDGAFLGIGNNLHRQVVGRRFIHRASGYIIPFYSTHISGGVKTGIRKEQVKELVETVRANWVPGDLPPIIVGDFNSGGWDRSIWGILRKDFVELGRRHNPGTDIIDHIWMGKLSRFPDAVGIGEDDGYQELSDFFDEACRKPAKKSCSKSDHWGVYIELQLPKEECVSIESNQLKVVRSKIGPITLWKLVSGDQLELVYAKSQHAKRMMAILRHFEVDQACHVGRKKASFRYFLKSGLPISGTFNELECSRIDPNSLEVKVKPTRKRPFFSWNLVHNEESLIDFERKEGEARRTRVLMQKYDFTEICYPESGSTYFQLFKK